MIYGMCGRVPVILYLNVAFSERSLSFLFPCSSPFFFFLPCPRPAPPPFARRSLLFDRCVAGESKAYIYTVTKRASSASGYERSLARSILSYVARNNELDA